MTDAFRDLEFSEEDARVLLAFVRALDVRVRADPGVADAWQAVLDGSATLDLARRAVRDFYSSPRDRAIQPGDLLALVQRYRREAWDAMDGAAVGVGGPARVPRPPCFEAMAAAAAEACRAAVENGFSRSSKVTRDSAFMAARAVAVTECGDWWETYHVPSR